MGIERNCPIDTWNADLVPRYSDGETLVYRRKDINRLLTVLSKECQNWQKSDGKIWWDSPESWLRKQLDLPKNSDLVEKVKK